MSPVFSKNFEIVPKEKAVVSVMDRSFLYGDSVYEVVRTYERDKPFLVDRHYQRMLRSAERIALTIPFPLSKLREHLMECLDEAQNEGDSYIRIVVSRGTDNQFSLLPGDHISPTTIILCDRIRTYPSEYFTKGASIALVSVRRNLRTALDPNVKSGNYLNNMMALMEANRRGASDAVMLNFQGEVTEATTSNVFMVKNNVVITPQVESGILEGISRGLLKEVARKHAIAWEERKVLENEFRAADEIFLTGTTKDVMPITKVDDRPVGKGEVGPMTKKLMELYHQEVLQILSKD